MAKTIDELKNEYMQTAAELGDVMYQLNILQDRQDELSNKMHNLNKQAQKLNAKATPETQKEPQNVESQD